MIYTIKTTDEFDNNTLERIYGLLCEKQKDYVDKKTCEKRKQSLCVRAALAEMLGEEVVPYIDMTESGKLLNLPDGRFISFSHSGKFVAAACSHRPIGIDIQIFKSVKDRTIRRICTDREAEYIKKNGKISFFDIWTVKEAFIKCFGVSFIAAKNLSVVFEDKIQISNCEYLRILEDKYCCSILLSNVSAD